MDALTASPAHVAHDSLVSILTATITTVDSATSEDAAREIAEIAALAVAERHAHTENTERALIAEGTSSTPYRATSRTDGTWADCHGINHSDSGEIVVHDRCGKQVVRREDGKIYDIIRVGAYQARKFQCWRGAHRCDPRWVALTAQERAQDAADGRVDVKAAVVQVFKGRKVPVGTEGQVFWVGEDSYSGKAKLGIRDSAGATHWVLAEHCKRIG